MGITWEEFKDSVVKCGYTAPSYDDYVHFAETTKSFTRNEMAMYLAQLIHESGGFKDREELKCVGNNDCVNEYRDNIGLPGKSYHGRGYMQLTWGANYKAASEGLGMKDTLLKQPELVSESVQLSHAVSAWYWKNMVRPQIKGKEDWFGATTKAINGAIECSGGYNERAHNRYTKYLKVAKALKIENKAKEDGCYKV